MNNLAGSVVVGVSESKRIPIGRDHGFKIRGQAYSRVRLKIPILQRACPLTSAGLVNLLAINGRSGTSRRLRLQRHGHSQKDEYEHSQQSGAQEMHPSTVANNEPAAAEATCSVIPSEARNLQFLPQPSSRGLTDFLFLSNRSRLLDGRCALQLVPREAAAINNPLQGLYQDQRE